MALRPKRGHQDFFKRNLDPSKTFAKSVLLCFSGSGTGHFDRAPVGFFPHLCKKLAEKRVLSKVEAGRPIPTAYGCRADDSGAVWLHIWSWRGLGQFGSWRYAAPGASYSPSVSENDAQSCQSLLTNVGHGILFAMLEVHALTCLVSEGCELMRSRAWS